MAFKTFAPGVLTSSDVNTFLMRQAVITCTSSTRPSSPSEGMTIYETDTNLYKVYDGSNWIDLTLTLGGAWESYTPTFGAGCTWTQGNGSFVGRYTRLGRVIFVRVDFELGSTTSVSGNQLSFTLPVSPTGSAAQIAGGGILNDDSLTVSYDASLRLLTSGGARVDIRTLQSDVQFAFRTEMTSSQPFSWATGDEIRILFMYEGN